MDRSRTHGDPFSFTPAPVDLVVLIENVVGLNEPLAREKSIELYCRLPATVSVVGDEDLLAHALDNLVNNAIKHTRHGGQVFCELAGDADNGPVIRVIDEGPGLSEQAVRKAFRPFEGLSTTNAWPSRSTGLGLWIARLIAERHGGQVDVASRSGDAGAVFSLKLPAHRDRAMS